MIDLGSIAGLLEHDHKLAAYCPRCGRWDDLPLAELISQGKWRFDTGCAARPVAAALPEQLSQRHQQDTDVERADGNRPNRQ